MTEASFRAPTPDPVASPNAYQDHLLGLVGDDDPITRVRVLRRWLTLTAGTAAAMVART